MAPLNVEGRVLLAEMTLPRDAAVTVEGGELAGAEERVEKRAVRDRAGCREVVFLVRRRQRALGVEAALPELLAIGAGERFDDEDGLVGRGRGASGAERPLAQGSGVASLYEPRTLAADPGADLRGHEHAVAADDGRRDAGAGDRRFPGDILGCAPFDRHTAIRRDAAGCRPAPVRPVVGMDEGDGANRCGGEGEDEVACAHDGDCSCGGATAETRVESEKCPWLRSAGCSLSSWDLFSPHVRPNASRRSPLPRLRLPPRLRRRRPRRSQRQRPRRRTTSSGCSGPPSTTPRRSRPTVTRPRESNSRRRPARPAPGRSSSTLTRPSSATCSTKSSASGRATRPRAGRRGSIERKRLRCREPRRSSRVFDSSADGLRS